MSLAIKQLQVYLRTFIVVLVAGAVGLVLFKNRSNTVRFWFFGLTQEDKPTNVVWLMLWTSAAAIITWRVFSFSRGLWRDIKEVARVKEIEVTQKQQEQRAAELAERERRLEEQSKRTAASDGEPDMKE